MRLSFNLIIYHRWLDPWHPPENFLCKSSCNSIARPSLIIPSPHPTTHNHISCTRWLNNSHLIKWFSPWPSMLCVKQCKESGDPSRKPFPYQKQCDDPIKPPSSITEKTAHCSSINELAKINVFYIQAQLLLFPFFSRICYWELRKSLQPLQTMNLLTNLHHFSIDTTDNPTHSSVYTITYEPLQPPSTTITVNFTQFQVFNRGIPTPL